MRRSIGGLLALVCTVGGLAVMTPSAAAPAASPTGPEYETLASSRTTVTTSTGRDLTLQVVAVKQLGARQRPVSFDVTLATGKAWRHGETHRWSFDLDRADLSWDRSAGRAKLTTTSELGRFGSMRLVFRQKQRHTETCAGAGSRTIVRGTLRGDLVFDTRSPHWGVVGESSQPFAFSIHPRSRFVIDHECLRGDYGEPLWCSTGVQWTRLLGGPVDNADGLAISVRGHRRRQLSASRRVHFAHPTGAYRDDNLMLRHQPDPLVRDHRLQVRTKPDTPVRGSASIGPGDVRRATNGCQRGSGTGTETYVYHSRGRFQSHRLRFLFHVGGVFRIPDGRASWTVYRSS